VSRRELLRTPALLLERFAYGESSLVAHLLTPDHGRVRVLAKGCFRPGSAHYCALDLFDTLEVELAQRAAGELAPLSAARVTRRRAGLARDLARYRCALAHLELAALGAREGHEERALYALAESALERLDAPRADPALERIVFDLAFLQNLGLAPALDACAACGQPLPTRPAPAPRPAWSRAAGGLLCARCAARARASGHALEAPAPAVLAIARAIAGASPDRTPSIQMQPAQSSALRAFVEGFLFHHLEQAPRSRRARVVGAGMLFACASLAALTGASLGCSSSGRRAQELRPEQAVARLAEVEAAAPTQAPLDTLRDLADLWNTANLPPETRVRLDERLEATLAAVLPALSSPRGDEDTLADLFDLDLPRRLRARIAVARARVLLDQGERKDAWRQIRELDALYSVHEERAAAGAVVAEAGLSMARDPGRYFVIFRYRDAAVEVLDDLLLHYPSEPRCVEAYVELAAILAEQHEFTRAIERLEELVVYFPDTPEAIEGELRIPELRMDQVGSAEKDRGGLTRAHTEVERWMESHADAMDADPRLALRARAAQTRAVRLVVDSDLAIAAYYRRIDQPTGQRLHAERALSVAESNQESERAARARELLVPAPGAPAGEPAREPNGGAAGAPQSTPTGAPRE
jgi:DNA repair protein RecO (recombination protein O)